MNQELTKDKIKIGIDKNNSQADCKLPSFSASRLSIWIVLSTTPCLTAEMR